MYEQRRLVVRMRVGPDLKACNREQSWLRTRKWGNYETPYHLRYLLYCMPCAGYDSAKP